MTSSFLRSYDLESLPFHVAVYREITNHVENAKLRLANFFSLIHEFVFFTSPMSQAENNRDRWRTLGMPVSLRVGLCNVPVTQLKFLAMVYESPLGTLQQPAGNQLDWRA